MYLNHCSASGQHTGFSCELTRTKSGDKLFVSPRRAYDLQTPSSHDEETRILRACFDKNVANLNRMDAAMAGYALDLFRLQYREHPLRSRGHTCQLDWRIGMRHFLIIIARSEDLLRCILAKLQRQASCRNNDDLQRFRRGFILTDR